MRYYDFEKRMLSYPVFTVLEAKNIFLKEKNITAQINGWHKKGYLIKLRKGLYLVANLKNRINPLALASRLYQPSYLSLEFALNYYGIIPDIPGTYTSVSSRKTIRYQNELGFFSFQKIKPALFTGYQALNQEGVSYNLALPEKALFDYLYLNKRFLTPGEDCWQELRLDEEFKFNQQRIQAYKKLFNDEKINQLISSLLKFKKNKK